MSADATGKIPIDVGELWISHIFPDGYNLLWRQGH